MCAVDSTGWAPFSEEQNAAGRIIARRFMRLVCKMLNMLDLGIGSDDVEEMWIVRNEVGLVPTCKPATCMSASDVLPFFCRKHTLEQGCNQRPCYHGEHQKPID